jgi:hypothetical protein
MRARPGLGGLYQADGIPTAISLTGVVSANVFTSVTSEQLLPVPAPPNIFFHPAARRRLCYIVAVFIAVTLLGLQIWCAR